MIRVLAAATVLLVIVVACSNAPPNPSLSPRVVGRDSRDLVLQDYLLGLERSDAAGIASLVGPTVDARRDIAAVLSRYGGLRLSEVTVRYLDEFGGVYVVATVVGTGNDSMQHEVKVPISRVNGRYFLALGQATPNGSEASPNGP